MVQEVMGQVFPGYSCAVDVQDRVEDLAQFDLGWPAGGPAVESGFPPGG
jgi:hypothetical protein